MQNDMLANAGKTECLRIGNLKKEGNYKIKDKEDIKFVQEARDLGVIFSETGDWLKHIHHVRTAIMKKTSWILRVFKNRSIPFMRFCWNCYSNQSLIMPVNFGLHPDPLK